ncbi:MAG: hypothetical protein Q7U97_06370 [Rhodocyclaceae bacterium]|nr:hypothetical protein [Rhodocyclaceae bacterium]
MASKQTASDDFETSLATDFTFTTTVAAWLLPNEDSHLQLAARMRAACFSAERFLQTSTTHARS